MINSIFTMTKPFLPMMRMTKLFRYTLIGLFPTMGFTQVGTQQIDPTYITISDGLASPNVQDVFQDSYGLIWIATTNGLQKYDGYRLETFKNIPGKAQACRTMPYGAWRKMKIMIFGSPTIIGISKYDRKQNKFINYDFAKIFNMAVGGGRVFNFLRDSQNRLWATCQNMELVMPIPA